MKPTGMGPESGAAPIPSVGAAVGDGTQRPARVGLAVGALVGALVGTRATVGLLVGVIVGSAITGMSSVPP